MPKQRVLNLKRYVPGYAQNPVKLAFQLLTNSNPAARSAVLMAAAGLALAPVDILLSRKEQNIYKSAKQPELPVLLVCGPPRSGTTLVQQYLVNSLDVAYINNLTSLFPRSPVYANRLFRKWVNYRRGNFSAFYGKSTGLSGTNDGLYLWDQWLGPDRDRPTTHLMPAADQGIQNFFGALQQSTTLPVVNKVNRLISSAHLIAPLLPTARFICVRRDPVMLAQSLLIARKQLTGSRNNAYGLHSDTKDGMNPIDDVCLQVEFLSKQIDRQQTLLGPERFIVINYSEFCHSPELLISRMRSEWNITIASRPGNESVRSFTARDQIRLPRSEFQRLQDHFDHMESSNS